MTSTLGWRYDLRGLWLMQTDGRLVVEVTRLCENWGCLADQWYGAYAESKMPPGDPIVRPSAEYIWELPNGIELAVCRRCCWKLRLLVGNGLATPKSIRDL